MKNRKPTADEMAVGRPHLREEIAALRPQLIVALGASAAQGLFNRPVAITAERGQWASFEGIPVMPTFHPSYLLRNQALSERRKVWEDLLQVMERLQLPISDKQRAFFLV
jgi:uracil-DNA glycosylase